MKYTDEVQKISNDLGIEFSVALDVCYMQHLILDMVACAKANPDLREFPVNHPELEAFIINNSTNNNILENK